MDQEKNPQIIYFKDLLFVALKRWRVALVLSVSLAVLLGGFKLVSAGISTTREDLDLATEQYQFDLEKQTVKYDALQKRLDNQQAYLDSSYLMALDPYHFYTVNLQIYVDTGYQINPSVSAQDTDKTATALTAYQASFTNASAMESLSAVFGILPQYTQELIACSTNIETGTLTVTVRCADTEDAAKVTEHLLTQLESFRKTISETVCEHTVNILSSGTMLLIDPELASRQISAVDQRASLQKSLQEAETALEALKNSTPAAVPLGSRLKSGAIFAVIGFVLGLVLTCVIFWLRHILSDKIYSSKTLTDRTGVQVFGVLPGSASRSSVDNRLTKAEGRCVAALEEQFSLLCADIRCRLEPGSTLMLAGSALDDDAAASLTRKMADRLPGIRIVSGNILTSASALETLKACDTVLLYEACHVSDHASVSRQAKFIRDYNKDLLGCILYGG